MHAIFVNAKHQIYEIIEMRVIKKLKCVIYVLNMLRDELFVNKYCMPSVLIMEGFYHSRGKKCNGKIKVLI